MKKTLVTLFFASLLPLLAGDYLLPRVALSEKNGYYASGEEAVVTAQPLKKGNEIAKDATVRGEIFWEGKSIYKKDFAVGEKIELRYKSDKPGWVHFTFAVIGRDGKPIENPGNTKKQFCQEKKLIYQIGALFDAKKLKISYPVPEDLDVYWKNFIKDGATVPMKVTYPNYPVPQEDRARAEKGGVDLRYYQITCKGPFPCFGYLAKPKNAKPKSLPLVICFQSWYNAPPSGFSAVNYAKRGALTVVTTYHGILPSATGEKYDMAYISKKQREAKFNAVGGINKKETWEFRTLFYRVARTIDYAKTLPEWNGKDIIVTGASLGGAQSAWAAAFYPGVTMSLVEIPGFCDFHGHLNQRAGCSWTSKKISDPAVQKTLAYYSVAAFATRIRKPTYWCTGFVDTGCHPSGVYACFNMLPAKTVKTMSTTTYTGHGGHSPNQAGGRAVDALLKRRSQETK